jgi:hypothetical protein
MAVNRELVERKVSLILQDLEKLRELAQLDLSDYLADFKNEAVAERFLERIIGRMIDVNCQPILRGLKNSSRRERDGDSIL